MDFINVPIGWVLKFFSNICNNNYILAILLFSIVVEVLMTLLFGIKQQKNSIKQARLRPKEMAIRKKYAGRTDKPTQQKMTMEIQELYQKEGYNPMGGCLPLLIQFPLLIAMYTIVVNPLKYICGLSEDAITNIGRTLYGTDANASRGTMGWLSQITEKGYEAFAHLEGEGFTLEVFENMPNLKSFGGALDLSITPKDCMNVESFKNPALWLVIAVPVLTFIAYFFSMKITRKFSYQPMDSAQQAQMGCSNKVMDIVMPLFSVFIAFGVPAALGVYWIFKSILGVISKIILSFAIPLPKFSDEDYKAAEREVNARVEKNVRVEKSGRVVRSLHHIDDEDFEDTREAALKHKAALEAQNEAEKANNTKKSGLVSAAPIKKDDRKENDENADNNSAE